MRNDVSILFPSFRNLEQAMQRYGIDISVLPIDDVFAVIARKLNQMKDMQDAQGH